MQCTLLLKDKLTAKKLQKDLNVLQDWEKEWDMEFKSSKCQVVYITRSKRPIQTFYSMHGQVLEAVNSARFLGVDIASDLKFTQGNLKRNIQTKHIGVREAAFKTIVRPQLQYASTVWSPHTKQDIKKN